MGQLEDMAVFIRIVESGGVSRAAEQLNTAKSAVSRRLTDLEKRVGSQLLSRTTRKSNLTDAGMLYYRRAKDIIQEVDELNEQTGADKTFVEGTLRITAPLSFGLLHMSDAIDEFAKTHEKLLFQLDFSDRHIDLIEEGFELAVRIGYLRDSTFHVRHITPIKHMLCAGPAYLEKYGIPKEPKDLLDHVFLQYGMGSRPKVTLLDKSDIPHELDVEARIKADNGDFLKKLALRGHGIINLPTFLLYHELAKGELIPLLPDYRLPEMHAYALYPKKRFLPQRCRLLVDFFIERFGKHPYWDRHIEEHVRFNLP